MECVLTYQGQLLGSSRSNSRASHKHDIRKVFHPQLRRLWNTHPALLDWSFIPRTHYLQQTAQATVMGGAFKKAEAYFAEQFERCGYRFVPLVAEDFHALCSIDILFLRPDLPGGVLSSGDIDNRLKTLFDALRMPKTKEELGGAQIPGADESPFYVLLEDDRLIDHVSVTTDLLLERVTPDRDLNANDARIVIKVKTKLTMATPANYGLA